MSTTRRRLLLGGALLPLAACTPSREAERPGPVDPDVALRDAAVARERALLASYDALLLASPDLAARLGPLRAEHAEHLAALGAQEQASTATPVPVPAPALPALVAAERAAAAAHAEATVGASPALAAVLAQLAASEASHPVALA